MPAAVAAAAAALLQLIIAATLSVLPDRIEGDVCLARAQDASPFSPGRPAGRPVTAVRPRRGHLHDRLGGLLHPDRRADRGPGRARPDLCGCRQLHGGLAGGQAGRPVRSEEMWVVSAAGQAAMFALWPFIDGFGGYVAMAVVMEVVGALGGAAHGAYTIDVLPPDERVRSRAYMYSALNVGFTLGSLIGGIALAFHSNTMLHALPWFTSVVFLVNAAGDLPAAARLARRAHPRGAQGEGPRAGTDAQRGLDGQRPSSCGVLLDQPGAAQHRDPAVAGRGDGRPAGAAGRLVRHQHGDVHLPADGGGAGRQGRHHCAEGDPGVAVFFVAPA